VNAEILVEFFPYIKHYGEEGIQGRVSETKFNKPRCLVMLGGNEKFFPGKFANFGQTRISVKSPISENEDIENF